MYLDACSASTGRGSAVGSRSRLAVAGGASLRHPLTPAKEVKALENSEVATLCTLLPAIDCPGGGCGTARLPKAVVQPQVEPLCDIPRHLQEQWTLKNEEHVVVLSFTLVTLCVREYLHAPQDCSCVHKHILDLFNLFYDLVKVFGILYLAETLGLSNTASQNSVMAVRRQRTRELTFAYSKYGSTSTTPYYHQHQHQHHQHQ